MPDIRDQIEKHIPRLRRYANVLAKNKHDANDLVQSALLLAIRKQHLYKEDISLRSWLFTILHNVHIQSVRSNARQGYHVDIEMEIIPVRERATSALLLRDLDRALKKLPPEQLAPIILIGIEEMSYEEAADILAIPLGMVRSRLWRARQQLREMLQWEPLRKAPHSRANEPTHKPGSGLPSEKPQHKHCIVSQNALVSSMPTPEPGSVHGSISVKNTRKIKEVCNG